jgi:demethylmenaquinone methyltransferase/2-methoxy-6-polyprenyl-1,4-benzoquinol methylase
MFSYIFMKILERQPRRYDLGICCLSLGRSEKIKRRIVEERVTPGCRMLEVGVGTGTLAILAAKKGATVLGFDISAGMLTVAREKAEAAGIMERVELREMGVGQMDKFPDAAFDLVISTLVFSELFRDEQRYALRHAFRLLKPGGLLILADETRPRSFFKRFLYLSVRIPLLLLTFVITQTTTRAVHGLEEMVAEAGFKTTYTERSFLDTFLFLIAVKE